VVIGSGSAVDLYDSVYKVEFDTNTVYDFRSHRKTEIINTLGVDIFISTWSRFDPSVQDSYTIPKNTGTYVTTNHGKIFVRLMPGQASGTIRGIIYKE